MPQMNLYIPDDLAERIRRAANAADLSVSRYLAELVRREVETEWPADYFETVIGGWAGAPLERASQGVAETRELFASGE